MNHRRVPVLVLASAALLAIAACGRPGPGLAHAAGPGAMGALARGPKLAFVPNQQYLVTLEDELDRPGLKSVDVLQFNFYADHGGDTQAILEKLVALKKRGVAVRVFLEGTREEPKRRHADTIAKLTTGGVDVRLTKQHLTHAKAVCFDGRRLLLGSTNWTVTSWNRNNETNALVDSPTLAKAFTGWYDRLWAGEEAMAPTTTTDGHTALLTDTAFYAEALAVIGRAERTLDVGTYFLALRKGREATSDAKVKALLDAVVARKEALAKAGKPLAVRFFLDNNGIRPELHKTHTLDAAANARDYLKARGIEEVWFDRYEQISHCKFILRDAAGGRGEVLFGSTNLYGGDFDHHHQLNVRTADPAMLKAFAGYMADRLGESAKEIREPSGGPFRINREGSPVVAFNLDGDQE